jgi:hypothetical protein
MLKTTKSKFSFSKIKEESNSMLQTFSSFINNGIGLFKKDESAMTKEEKIEKQHVMTFIYGMVAGVIVYHFLIGVVLIAVVIGLYGYSVQKPKSIMREDIDDNIIDAEITKK